MSATVRIPSGMQNVTKGQGIITVKEGSIDGIITELESSFPGIRELLCNEDGNLRKFVMLAVDGIDIRTLDGMDTKVPPSANIDIVRAFAGG